MSQVYDRIDIDIIKILQVDSTKAIKDIAKEATEYFDLCIRTLSKFDEKYDDVKILANVSSIFNLNFLANEN